VPGFPGLSGPVVAGNGFVEAFTMWRDVGLDYEGRLLALPAATAIHMAHRVGALIVFLYVGWLASHVLRVGTTHSALRMLVLLVLLAEVALGIMEVVTHLPLAARWRTTRGGIAIGRTGDPLSRAAGAAYTMTPGDFSATPVRSMKPELPLCPPRTQPHPGPVHAREYFALTKRGCDVGSYSPPWLACFCPRRRRCRWPPSSGDVGIALAAASAAAINHVLDRKLDAAMARTRARPLPTGTLTSRQRWCSLMLGSMSMLILGLGANTLTAALTFISLIGYSMSIPFI